MAGNEMETVLFDGLMYMMEGKDPSLAIENQEKRGQQEVVRNQRLPKYVHNRHLEKEDAKRQYEKMGIVVLNEYDDLFYNVQLPNGWKIKATDHSMWNELRDDKNRLRAKFFYKAAFYDRDAFVAFETRFHMTICKNVGYDAPYDKWEAANHIGKFYDGDMLIFETAEFKPSKDYFEDEKIKKKIRKQLNSYADNYCPRWKDINAYWDD